MRRLLAALFLVPCIVAAQGSVVVSPSTDTLAIGSTVKLGRTVTTPWSSLDPGIATVNSNGLVTAKAPGTARIVVGVGGVADTALIIVPGADTTTPPTGSNEPAGMTVLTNRAFNAKQETGWQDDGTSKIVSDATAPSSPPNILRTTLPAGFRPGSGTASGDFTFAAYRTVYVSYWARYSINWQGGEAGLDKQFYLYTSTGHPSLVFVGNGSGAALKTALMEGQDILAGGAGHGDAANPDWGPNLGPSGEMVRGKWFHVEWIIVGNSASTADGTIDGYMDGAHIIHYTGIKFLSTATKWSWFHYTNIWTGTSGSVQASQDQDFDGFYLSAK